MRPLYIQDFGFYCNLGSDKPEVFEKLKNGIRGDMGPWDFAGQKKYAAVIDPKTLPAIEGEKFNNRINRLASVALDKIEGSVRKAVQKYGADRIGIFIGSCDNGSEVSLNALKSVKETGAFPKGYVFDYQSADLPGRYIAERFGIKGPVSVHSTACSSSASAFVSARNNIYAGFCDAAIVGGVDIASLAVVLGFSSLESVSPSPTNPFSKNRSGLTIGDGAAFFLVTKDDLDLKDPASIAKLCVLGFGESADADHITAPRADGLGAAAAMKAALADAEISPEDICYINLHGTGTYLNDAMESRAVNMVFGSYVPASSTKALTGHTLAAAGALEAAFCCLSLQDESGYMPAHLYDGVPDDELPPIRLVKPLEKMSPNAKGKRIAISNSFAFGGCNVSLVIARG